MQSALAALESLESAKNDIEFDTGRVLLRKYTYDVLASLQSDTNRLQDAQKRLVELQNSLVQLNCHNAQTLEEIEQFSRNSVKVSGVSGSWDLTDSGIESQITDEFESRSAQAIINATLSRQLTRIRQRHLFSTELLRSNHRPVDVRVVEMQRLLRNLKQMYVEALDEEARPEENEKLTRRRERVPKRKRDRETIRAKSDGEKRDLLDDLKEVQSERRENRTRRDDRNDRNSKRVQNEKSEIYEKPQKPERSTRRSDRSDRRDDRIEKRDDHIERKDDRVERRDDRIERRDDRRHDRRNERRDERKNDKRDEKRDERKDERRDERKDERREERRDDRREDRRDTRKDDRREERRQDSRHDNRKRRKW